MFIKFMNSFTPKFAHLQYMPHDPGLVSPSPGPTEAHRGGLNRRCSACGSRFRPRVDPAMIVLVTRGERCLLGRTLGL